jgi:cysteinyl-tRNA synthetase
MNLFLYNTLSNKKEIFSPINQENIEMYVCGPTVYDRAHLGNARSVVVYDILYRVLRKIYPKVSYLRNITDVDDKIINKAMHEGVPTSEISSRYTNFFHEDMNYLHCLKPSYEPKATEHIQQMINLIQKLIEKDAAYIRPSGVYFDISKFSDYGKLSRRKIDDQNAGARIVVNDEKKNPDDFALWKLEDPTKSDAIFNSPWGKGRPGWHIECSAMTYSNFGYDFDIHGGGSDLKFPHHENEIAQVCCAYPEAKYAKYWVHNGFLTVNGEKMSKSLKNFITVQDLKDQGVKGSIARYCLLMSDYKQPLDWNENLVNQAKNNLSKVINLRKKVDKIEANDDLYPEFWSHLLNDINTPAALMSLQTLANNINSILNKGDECNDLVRQLINSFRFIGIDIDELFEVSSEKISDEEIESLILNRKEAKSNKNFFLADQIRDKLKEKGISLIDKKDGSTIWERAY